MWPGPYGIDGSRKHLLGLDQSLKQMKLDYVDVFYSHRYDPDTPLEETMAGDTAVQQGKALYVGISSYSAEDARGGSDPQAPGRALRAAPALLLAAQPLDRGRFARHAARRSRSPTAFAAGAGVADLVSISPASRPIRARPRAPRRSATTTSNRRWNGFAR